MGFLQNFNYLYFAIITTLSLLYVFGRTMIINNPLNKEQKLRLEGIEAFWILIFSTGLLALNVSMVIDLMAIRLFVIEILCVIAILFSQRRPVLGWVSALYLIYLTWLIIGCSYAPSVSYGIRVILKYVYAFLIMLTASVAVRNHEVFIKASLGAIALGVVCLCFDFIPFLYTLVPGVWWYSTAQAIHFISLMVLCLSFSFFCTNKLRYRVLTIAFLIPCFIWVLRTSIFGSFAALSAFSIIKYRVKSIPIILLLLGIGVIATFSIPSLHEKMFKDESTHVSLQDFREGRITTDDVQTNYREVMWEKVYTDLYERNKLIGCGTGTLQETMYTHTEDFGNLMVIHNDYLQMMCDNGLIGLVLYILIGIFIFAHCFTVYHNASNVPIKICSLAAGASIIGVGVTLYSDNTVNYSMATLSMPYGLYGMLLGLLQQQKPKHAV